jgi:hypothetical protein
MSAENTGEQQDASHQELSKPPSKEALDACSGINQGDTCELSTPDGTKAGICQTVWNKLACVPTVKQRRNKGLQ